MSLTLNMVGGGGGGLSATDALLRVQAPAGSTVTITKGGTTKTDLGHENADDHTVYDYYFIIHQSQFDSQNAWTVTATLGANTASSTVIINAADEYDVILSYHVPPEYQEVEYIENTSVGPYISTSIVPTINTKAQIKLMNYSDANIVFGEITSNDTTDWRLHRDSGTSAKFDVGSTRASASNNTFDANTVYEFELGNCYIKDLSTGTTIAQATTVTSFSANNAVISLNKSNATNSTNRWYYVKIWESNTLVAEMYPCYRKADSVVGMWDKVSETFLTNQGSGSFVVGGDV